MARGGWAGVAALQHCSAAQRSVQPGCILPPSPPAGYAQSRYPNQLEGDAKAGLVTGVKS
jgi:hypothetical protein